ncbi:xanthine/uracil permease [Legionella birminghamensis]|uniref:Xanthine/uracil permease n=2 Tax=Legionella birminghamensis TaxID=28083 RepID=A0A378I5F0_9GAMM|nr:xanthine/uracil permease [Legionella birminghamensis]STX30428.1 putative MFS transporter, AGZA family, xanthine/uracil permease [Legionella birminghamensis]
MYTNMDNIQPQLSHSSRFSTEILAGITSFLTMVYIVFVNPVILHDAGMDQGSVFTATCLVTAFTTLLTGLIANAPIGVAPGMALNIYFSYSVVLGMGIPWQQALAMVFVSGSLFLLLSLTPLRKRLVDSIPDNLQLAILIGISFLIALIALQSNQIIISNAHTLLQMGNLARPEAGLFFLGFIMILIFDYFKISGAIILSILSISLISLATGLVSWQGIFALPPSMAPTFLKLDFSSFTSSTTLKATFTFFLIALFDATGTLIGLLNQSLFRDQEDNQQRIANSLSADAAGSMLAGLLGSASTSPFIESASGIEAGGRTGLTAVVIAAGFLLMLFFFPLAKMIPVYAVGPALLYVACCMMKHMVDLKLSDMTEIAPCMLTIIMIPLTSSIADGIGVGIILYTLLKLLSRQRVKPFLIVLSLTFAVFFLLS